MLRASLERQGLPADAVGLLEGGHGAVRALMTARGLVDLLIPRGGADLIQTVVTESTVPVIETGVGNCHVYVDRAADLDKALAITVNSKTHRPSVCNAAESLLVHRDVAAAFLPKALAALSGEGVTLHTDADAGAQADAAGVAHDAVTDEDFATEFHGLEMAVGVVDDLDAALEHIRRYGIGPHRGDRHRGPRGRRAGSPPRSTRPPSWSTRAPASPTAASSASAPRSASRPRSCTPAARWPCPS